MVLTFQNDSSNGRLSGKLKDLDLDVMKPVKSISQGQKGMKMGASMQGEEENEAGAEAGADAGADMGDMAGEVGGGA